MERIVHIQEDRFYIPKAIHRVLGKFIYYTSVKHIDSPNLKKYYHNKGNLLGNFEGAKLQV